MNPKVAFMGADDPMRHRGYLLGQNLKATPIFFNNEDAIVDDPHLLQDVTLVFVPVMDIKNESQMSARVQTIKYGAPDAWIVVIGDKKISQEGAEFLKKSGAQVVISEDRFFNTIEPEFIASLKIHGQWLPIKASELAPDKTIPFTLYHFMPLNKKFVVFAPSNTTLDHSKIEKAKKVGEVYFRRDDFDLFQRYVTENEDRSAAGLTARCRHQYMSAIVLFKELGLLLTDISEQASFQKGKELLSRCHAIADDFVMALGTVGDAWSIVNNAGFDDLTPIDRAPAIGAMASLMGLLIGVGNPTQIFLCAMIADLGLLDLPPTCLKIIQTGQFQELKGEAFELYRMHPLISINRLLSRKLPLDEKTRNIVLATHEQVNGKGFPNSLEKERILIESQLIHLAEILDGALKVQEGKERRDPKVAMRSVLQEMTQQQEVISIELVFKVLNHLV
jgi:response regulator RpfG family c-di-GMP phosphodiesterase